MTGKELEQIYNEAYKAVYWTAMSLLKNEADAEDVVQDTFVSFIESYSDLTDTSKATALLKKIAANKSLNRIKLAKTDVAEDEFFDNVEAVPEDFLPDSIVESDEARKIVMDIINNYLSEDVRRTLILFYFDDLSTKEIAEVLGVPQGTVLRRLNYARNKIKKEVEKYEKDNDTKLFGMAIPFLTKLFIKESEQVAFKPMPASLANLSASAEAPSQGAGIKASKEAAKKGTEIMKTKIIISSIAAVIAVGITVGVIVAVLSKKKDQKPEPKHVESAEGEYEEEEEETTTTETTKAIPKADKDLFRWSDNTIIDLTDEGRQAEVLVIPAECDGIDCCLDNGIYTEVYFESDNDINIGVAFSGSHTVEKIVLPKNLSSLDVYAFSDCSALKEIELPEGLTEMGAGVFQDCVSLKSMEIPAGVTVLPSFLFCGCTNLESVTIKGDVTKIGSACFIQCTNLKSIEIPSTVKTIGFNCFADCKSLTSVDLPEGLENLDTDIFSGCSSMTSLRIPSSVKDIGQNILLGSGVTDVYVPADLELTEWEHNSFWNSEEHMRIHVTAGSWADANFDDVFIGYLEKTYD